MRRRRNYSDADKRRLIEEATRENASVSGVARKYGISTDLMFRWRKKLGMGPMHRIVPVTITDTPDGLADLSVMTARPAPPVPEAPGPAIEIELVGGRRLRLAAALARSKRARPSAASSSSSSRVSMKPRIVAKDQTLPGAWSSKPEAG